MHFLAVIALAISAATALAAQPEMALVRGELITVMCFVGNGEQGRGTDHAACALKCATEGYPLAIVTKQGDVYKIVGALTDHNNLALRELLAKEVVGEGQIGEEGAGKTLNANSIHLAPEPR